MFAVIIASAAFRQRQLNMHYQRLTTAEEPTKEKLHAHSWGKWGDPEHVGQGMNWIQWHSCRKCGLAEWSEVNQVTNK